MGYHSAKRHVVNVGRFKGSFVHQTFDSNSTQVVRFQVVEVSATTLERRTDTVHNNNLPWGRRSGKAAHRRSFNRIVNAVEKHIPNFFFSRNLNNTCLRMLQARWM